MAMNSLPASRRLRSAQRIVRDVRMGQTLSEAQIMRLETMIADCAADVEQLEIAAGTGTVDAQLKAAGSNPVMMRAVLQQAASRKAVRHG